MIDSDNSLKRAIDSVHNTMLQCKRRLTNRSRLRNLTDLSPVVPNATRWSGNKHMLCRFSEIREDLIIVASTESTTLTIDRSDYFPERVDKLAKMLTEIDTVTLKLQKSGASLACCRYVVDILRESVETEKQNPNSNLYGCKLK